MEMKAFIEQISREAGTILRGYFGKIGVMRNKSDTLDVLTEADLAANDFLLAAIKKEYPDHGILSEETGYHQKNAEWLWTIDPLDGTLNFSRRIPLFAVMLSVSKKSAKSQSRDLRYAAIYDVMQDEMFYAEKGKGALRNGKKIQTSKKTEWEETFGALGSRPRKNNRYLWDMIVDEANKRNFGFISPAAAGTAAIYTADGRCDWWIGKGGHIWDYAPAVLILKEAGCDVLNHDGKPWSWEDEELVAANPSLLGKLAGCLHQYKERK